MGEAVNGCFTRPPARPPLHQSYSKPDHNTPCPAPTPSTRPLSIRKHEWNGKHIPAPLTPSTSSPEPTPGLLRPSSTTHPRNALLFSNHKKIEAAHAHIPTKSKPRTSTNTPQFISYPVRCKVHDNL